MTVNCFGSFSNCRTVGIAPSMGCDAISPAIIGYIADRTSLKAGFLVVSAMIVLGGLLWLWASRYLGRDTAAVEAASVPAAPVPSA